MLIYMEVQWGRMPCGSKHILHFLVQQPVAPFDLQKDLRTVAKATKNVSLQRIGSSQIYLFAMLGLGVL
jgi:hypothetical protein